MRSRWPILAIFVLSGAAGLIYEIVWSRQLVLVFGNTTQAVSAILAGFFGGMAIGSAFGGRLADRVRSPLRLYGLIELVLVVVVIATPFTFRVIRAFYGEIAVGLEDSPQLLALIRLGLALLALAPATILMGATLPTLTRHLSANAHLSQSFGRLYAANTIGAIIGTLVAGLVLIEVFGLTGALFVGAGCSAIAGVVALAIARRSTRDARDVPVAPVTAAPREPEPAGPGAPDPRPHRGVHLRPDIARLPGAVDTSAGLRDRQHDLRVHDHPRGLPHRPGDRGVALQLPPSTDHRPDPTAGDGADPGRRPRHGWTRCGRRPTGGAGARRQAGNTSGAYRIGDPGGVAGHDRARTQLPGGIGAAVGRRQSRRARNPALSSP